MVTVISSKNVGGLGAFASTDIAKQTDASDAEKTLWTFNIPPGTFNDSDNTVLRAWVHGTLAGTAIVKTLRINLGGTAIAEAAIDDDTFTAFQAHVVLSGNGAAQMGAVQLTLTVGAAGGTPEPANMEFFPVAPQENDGSEAISLTLSGQNDTATDSAGTIVIGGAMVEVSQNALIG